MTFHVGQLVVCVEGGPSVSLYGVHENNWGDVLERQRIYRVRRVKESDCRPGVWGVWVHGVSGGWRAERFRPLIDEADDADLIARIKACKPVRQPVTAYDHVHFEIPDARHPTGCDTIAGNDGRAAPTAGAPVTIRSTRAKAPDDLLNKGTKSLRHATQNTQNWRDDHAHQ